jgi:hypothetical protein
MPASKFLSSAFFLEATKEEQMPLFFLIAIGAGAMTLGATTVDVTSDSPARDRANHTAQVQQVQPQPQAQATVYTLSSSQQSM